MAAAAAAGAGSARCCGGAPCRASSASWPAEARAQLRAAGARGPRAALRFLQHRRLPATAPQPRRRAAGLTRAHSPLTTAYSLCLYLALWPDGLCLLRHFELSSKDAAVLISI